MKLVPHPGGTTVSVESGQRGLVPPEAETARVFVELLGPGCKVQTDTPPQG